MNGLFWFSLSAGLLNKHHCADPAVWAQDKAGTAFVSMLFTKTKNLAHSLEDCITFVYSLKICKLNLF